MPSITEWSVAFYVSESGQSPVKKFIRSLDKETKARFAALIDLLRENEGKLDFPHARKLEGKLWELRLSSKTNIYRAVYFTHSNQRIVILHAFQKKTQKTDDNDLEIARRRYAELISR